MKLVKNKKSDMLFEEQEALKQSKVQAYAKKLGLDPTQFAFGGAYPGMSNPYHKFKGDVPIYAKGGMKGLPKYWAGGEEGEEDPLEAARRASGQFRSMSTPLSKAKLEIDYKTNKIKAFNKMTGNTNPGYNIPQSYWLNPEAIQASSDAMIEESYPKAQSTTEPVVTIKPVNNNQSNESPEAYQRRVERESRDAALLADTGDTSSNKKLNWGEIAGQAGMFAANNAGNFYNLSRYNKPEVETYGRVKANLLNPKQALQDVRNQTNLSKKAMKDVTGGNMANAIANLVGLNSKYNQDIARTNQSYDNANASIRNQIYQYNNQVAMQEIIANAQNRARTRSGKGEAIASLGSNTANQFMDNKKGKMDQKTLNLMMKYYNKYPAFAKMLEEEGWA
jgi:hypothetical protein